MKKNYKKPTMYQVKAGAILPIYMNYKEQKDLLGYAKLNYRVKSNVEELPYVRAEIGGRGKKEADTIIWGYRRYNITYVDPWEYDKSIPQEERNKYLHQVGFTTNWKISFFIKVSSYN